MRAKEERYESFFLINHISYLEYNLMDGSSAGSPSSMRYVGGIASLPQYRHSRHSASVLNIKGGYLSPSSRNVGGALGEGLIFLERK